MLYMIRRPICEDQPVMESKEKKTKPPKEHPWRMYNFKNRRTPQAFRPISQSFEMDDEGLGPPTKDNL